MRIELTGWSCHSGPPRQIALHRDSEADGENDYRNYGPNLHMNLLFASKCRSILERGPVFVWTVHHGSPLSKGAYAVDSDTTLTNRR